MKILTYEATVENGEIRLSEPAHLPEHTRVYVVVPSAEEVPGFFMRSPRLAHPEQAMEFIKEVIEDGSDAGL